MCCPIDLGSFPCDIDPEQGPPRPCRRWPVLASEEGRAPLGQGFSQPGRKTPPLCGTHAAVLPDLIGEPGASHPPPQTLQAATLCGSQPPCDLRPCAPWPRLSHHHGRLCSAVHLLHVAVPALPPMLRAPCSGLERGMLLPHRSLWLCLHAFRSVQNLASQ